jgi:geranylgeranyl pyrophosphate synthase
MADSADYADYFKKQATLIDRTIESYLNNVKDPRFLASLIERSGYTFDINAIEKSILEPANYLLKSGGKRWRPILMLELIEALGKDPNYYFEFSVIPEVIHNGTLIHDDIEDGSVMRRGMEALHKKYGLDIALNLGDFMFYFPIIALLDSKKIPMATKSRVLETYQRNMLKISIGQATDMAWHSGKVKIEDIDEDKYLQMAYSKTGVLIGFAAELAGIFCEVSDEKVKALGTFGATLGVAFQIEDDILNITPSKLSQNKGGVGDDITEGKITLMLLHAVKEGDKKDKERLQEIIRMHTSNPALINEAINILNKYDSIAYAKKVEKELLQKAWEDIDKLLPPSQAKERIRKITEMFGNRNV